MRLTDFTHELWKTLVPQGSFVIDATCGAGFDTLFLAELALSPKSGRLVGFDIQKEALEKTEGRLKKVLPPQLFARIELLNCCHTQIKEFEQPSFIAYNLGYLPTSNKKVTTESTTTLLSVKSALQILVPGGWISIMCYDGHDAGKKETADLMTFCQTLPTAHFRVHLHRLWNTASGPQTLLIQKCDCWPHEIERAANKPGAAPFKKRPKSALN